MSKQAKKPNSLTKILIVIFLIAVVGLSLYIYLVPKVSDILTDKYTAEYGTLSVGEDAEYLAVRSEKLYKSDRSGEVKRLVDQGEIQKTKTSIVSVGSEKFTSKERGVISFYYDNFEEKFTPENMADLKVSAIRLVNESVGEGESVLKEAASGNAEAGEAIFKTVDNQEWYIIVWLEKVQAKKYTVGKSVTTEFEDGTQLDMKVHSLTEQGSTTQVILSCNRYYEDFDKVRTGKIKLISTQKSGIILETNSIVNIDGHDGVYVINKVGENVFKPIKILATSGDKTVVEKNYFYDSEGNYTATVKIYDIVLRIDVADKNANEGEKNVN